MYPGSHEIFLREKTRTGKYLRGLGVNSNSYGHLLVQEDGKANTGEATPPGEVTPPNKGGGSCTPTWGRREDTPSLTR